MTSNRLGLLLVSFAVLMVLPSRVGWAKSTPGQIKVQSVPMVRGKGRYHLPHYYNQMTDRAAVPATMSKVQARLHFEIKKPMQYMAGVTTGPSVPICLLGFGRVKNRKSRPGQILVEGKSPEPKHVRAPGVIDVKHVTSVERDILFKVINKGLRAGDVKLYVDAAAVGDSHHLPMISLERAFLEFQGKVRGKAEWIPTPVRVSDIVKGARKKLGVLAAMKQVLRGRPRFTPDSIADDLARELSIPR